MNTMNITKAKAQAKSEVVMMKMGHQWQVSVYDADKDAWWVGICKDYFSARSEARSQKERIAYKLMGWVDEFGNALGEEKR